MKNNSLIFITRPKQQKIPLKAIKKLINYINKIKENKNDDAFNLLYIKQYFQNFDKKYKTNIIDSVWEKYTKNFDFTYYCNPLIFIHKDGTKEKIWEMDSPIIKKLLNKIKRKIFIKLMLKKIFNWG